MKTARNSNHFWTEEDIIFLKEHYATSTIKYVMQKLGRSSSSIYHKAHKLHLKRIIPDDLGLTLYELSQLTNIYYGTLSKFIQNGMSYNTFTCGTQKKIILVTPEYFWEYAKDHKDSIDFSKIQPLTILPEPEWFYEYRKIEKNFRRNYSITEIHKIQYLRSKGYTCQQIAKELGRTFYSIRSAVHRYSIKKE